MPDGPGSRPLLTSRPASATRGASISGADQPSVTEEAMPEQPVSASPAVSAGELLRHRAFLFFLLSRSLSRFSSQIAAVAIGWQIYDLTGSAFDLGMVGLVQFAPTALLVFVAGHAADRFERKRVVQLCQLVEAATALYLAVITYLGAVSEVQIFVATFVLGIAGAFESPTTAALLAVDRAAGLAPARNRRGERRRRRSRPSPGRRSAALPMRSRRIWPTQ